VAVLRHLGGGMFQRPAHHLRLLVGQGEQRAGSVAQVMQLDPWQPCSFEDEEVCISWNQPLQWWSSGWPL
jgi:hypothetical protein